MKYNPSIWLPELSGAAGGTIASRNRYGPYFKNNAVPINPQSVRQTLMRTLFTSRSQFWRGLTQGERDQWIQAAINFPYTDQFGNPYILQGSDLYIALNTVLLNTAQSILTSPPTPVAVTSFTSFSVLVMSTVSANLTFAPTPTPPAPVGTRQSTTIYATPGLSPGINYFHKYLRQITVLAGGTGTGVSVFAAYVAKYGTPIAGTKVGFAAIPSRDISGQQGIRITSSTIVLP